MARSFLAAAKRWYTEARLASLERRLRQDVTDQRTRRSAVALHCRRASFGAEERQESLQQAQKHLEHLAENCKDVIFLHDVLTRAIGPKLFYEMPGTIARCMRKIGLDDLCTEEFGSRSCFEERATQYHIANALMILKSAGEDEVARDLFDEACDLEWQGKKPISWTSLRQTPAVHIQDLRHQRFWETEDRPKVASVLEDMWQDVRQDFDELLEAQKSAANGVPAYPALVAGDGDWDMLQIYVNKRWHEKADIFLPRAFPRLKSLFPTTDLPYIHYNTEEVVLFRLTPGSRVHLHNGGSNVPVNMSLGLRGCEGSWVEVGGEARPFQERKVVCFDDGSDHRVWHDGQEDRWVLTVRVMHPELVQNPGKFFQHAWTRRTCFEAWDIARHDNLTSMAAASKA